jgi:ankyrin repeat protein
LLSGGSDFLVSNHNGELHIHYVVSYVTLLQLAFHCARHRNVLGTTDDVVEMLDYLVGRNPAFLSSRDHDGTSPIHVACRRRGAFFAIVY